MKRIKRLWHILWMGYHAERCSEYPTLASSRASRHHDVRYRHHRNQLKP